MMSCTANRTELTASMSGHRWVGKGGGGKSIFNAKRTRNFYYLLLFRSMLVQFVFTSQNTALTNCYCCTRDLFMEPSLDKCMHLLEHGRWFLSLYATRSPYHRLLAKYFVQEIIFLSFTYHCVLFSFRLHSQPTVLFVN